MNERKFSAKRVEILDLLKFTKTHPGAHWIYEQLKPRIPGLSLATVYRNLNIFCSEGKAVSLGVVRSEERFDGILPPHPHLICSDCGEILDLPSKKAQNLLQKSFYMEDSFFIDFRKTLFYGLCKACYKNHNKNGGGEDAA